ncbi:MAG: DUF1194 domain-containing protein [Acetobacteraceae bacterium]
MLRRRVLCQTVPMLLAGAAARADGNVSLQLVLAVDASGSVDMDRFELQKNGYATAFRSEVVRSAIRNTITGSIAVTMMQWTGPRMQTVIIDWFLIDGDGAAERFATEIDRSSRQLFGGGTSISGAIDFSADLFAIGQYRAPRRVIDVSGDGANNRGRPSSAARDDAVAAGIIINGLPILAVEPYLDKHYSRDVIGGPSAFMIPAKSYDEFAQAIRSKLVTEIAGIAPGRDATATG